MSVNNSYRFLVPTQEKYINVPLELKWDLTGRQDDIDEFENKSVKEVIGTATNFEVARYSHKEYGQNNQTSINYQFYFYNSPTSVTASTVNDWVNSYIFNSANPSGFSVSQVYYYRRPFTNSFFKLDFYDTPDSRTQKNYITVILPVQQGELENAYLTPLIPIVQIKKPSMILDFVGDKEGFFIYWLRVPEFINIDTFYMSAKFFDARQGVFVRMMTTPQASLPNAFIFDTNEYFFQKVVIDYNTKQYEILDSTNTRIGTGTPIKWYEYINP